MLISVNKKFLLKINSFLAYFEVKNLFRLSYKLLRLSYQSLIININILKLGPSCIKKILPT